MQVSMTRLRRNFSRAAPDYDERAEFQHVQTRRVFDMALRLLPRRALIADIGCGTGYFSKIASTERPDWLTIGIDLAWGMCEIAATRTLVVNADANGLPFANGTFEAAVSSLCYQWIENQARAFEELTRILKPGGRAIIATLGLDTLCELREFARSADIQLQLLPMRDFAETRGALAASGLIVSFEARKIERHFYDSVASLMDSMRLIGAGNNFSKPRRKSIGAKRWKSMIDGYDQIRVTEGLPASWEHHFFVLSKPD